MILHYKEQARLYELIAPKNEHFTDEQLCRFLNLALIGIENVQSVKSLYEDQQRAAGKGAVLTFSQYIELLFNKAAIYGAGRGRKSNTKNRNLNVHEFESDDEDDVYNGLDDFTSETDVDTVLEVMVHSAGNGSKYQNKSIANQSTSPYQ